VALQLQFKLDAPRLDINVDIKSRSIGISGPSGIGKSTLLRVIAGLETRALGVVRFEGVEFSTPPESRRIGWVPQDSLLFPQLSVRQNLLFSASDAHSATLGGLASSLGIEAILDRQPRNLSGGERQRVALGRALLRNPSLLLLDEPFAALDDEFRRRAVDTVLEWRTRLGFAVVLVTHDAQDQRELVDSHYTLADGRLFETA
jgi:ABC-type sugar transport system ATPase subunit